MLQICLNLNKKKYNFKKFNKGKFMEQTEPMVRVFKSESKNYCVVNNLDIANSGRKKELL